MLSNQRAHKHLKSISVIWISLLAYPRLGMAQARSSFFGSVPTGQASGTTLELSLKDAFARALKYNLGAIESGENTRAAQAVRLRLSGANIAGRTPPAGDPTGGERAARPPPAARRYDRPAVRRVRRCSKKP